jgi:hypothetical protein
MQGIQSNPESVEQIRERLRKMSDLELRKFGRAAKLMSDPTKHFGQPNPAFIQLQDGVDGTPVDPNEASRNSRLPDL